MSRHDRQALTLEQRAHRRVALKTGWLIHATVFTLVNLGLFLLGLANGHTHWSVFPLGGWGIALAIHGAVVLAKLNGEGLRQRWVDQELAALRQREAHQ